MAFHNMPDLGVMMLPGAAEYGEECIRQAKAAAEHVPHEMDIAYGTDPYQQLDIWWPRDKPDMPLPVFVNIHGGAFRNGHKEWMGGIAPALFRLMPCIMVSFNYRLTRHAPFPAPVDDCFDALAWTYRNIAKHGGDPDRIFLSGHSAGAHLAASLALRRDELKKRKIPVAAIRACFPVSGVFSLMKEGHPADSIVSRMWDEWTGGDMAVARDATVLNHLKGNRVPFYIAHGESEPAGLAHDNELLVNAARDGDWLLAHDVLWGLEHFTAHLHCHDVNGLWLRCVAAIMAEND